MQRLQDSDQGVPDAITIRSAPGEISEHLSQITTDPLFQASFGDVPTDIALVAIDALVAPQREVNLDYVAELTDRISAAGTDMLGLVKICLETRADPPSLRALQNAPNQITFTSRSLDLRFLGGFPKELNESDIAVAHFGGQPVTGIILLVGFGAAPINGWRVGSRVILANGFHRVVALRGMGVTEIPMVLRLVTNPEIEFPQQYLGLPRTYLLQYPRPVIIRDFFDSDLTVELALRPRRKVLTVAWEPGDSVVPE